MEHMKMSDKSTLEASIAALQGQFSGSSRLHEVFQDSAIQELIALRMKHGATAWQAIEPLAKFYATGGEPADLDEPTI
jgi:hypothetical protein